MMKSSVWMLVVALLGAIGSTDAADEATRYEWGQHGDEQIMEGDIVLESSDGTRKVARLLGGPLGNETIDGIGVGLYVLQATNPERLEPGSTGPTHLFNVSFKADDGGRLITDALGAVVVEGPGEPQRVAFRPQASHHQAQVRLDQEGEYRIRVEFVIEGRRGETQSFPFLYQRKPGPFRHDHQH